MDENKRNHAFLLKLTCVISSIIHQLKYIILISLICAIGLDIYKTVVYSPIYQTKMNAYLLTDSNTYDQLEKTQSFITTMNYVFNGQTAQNYVKSKLNQEEIDLVCTLTSVDNSNQIVLSVKSSKKAGAYFGLKYLIEWYDQMEEKMNFDYKLVEDKAYLISDTPINSNSHIANLKLGLMIGFILSCFVLFVFYYMKDTIKTPYDIEEKVKCRLYAKLPKEYKPLNKKFWIRNKSALLITSIKTSFYYKESIKKLRHRLEESSKKHDYHVIMITSSLENEGKSSIAANLALSLAENHHKVLLIDADFRKPSLHKIFRLNHHEGLNDYIDGDVKWTSLVTTLKKRDLGILCTRPDEQNAEDNLSSAKFKKLLDEARYAFDYVIVDSAPARYLNDTIVLNELMDATLLVVRQDKASVQVINDTLLRLVNVKNNVIGCIYNASVVDLVKRQHTYGYHYGYSRYNTERRQVNG
ncbi:MAG: polysaccharide biosynthesis tyrosine autokinase [Traorella sp.]